MVLMFMLSFQKRRRASRFCAVFILFLVTGCARQVPPPRPPVPVQIILPVPSSPLQVETLQPAPDRVAELKPRIDQIIDSMGFEDAIWGVKIVSVDKNEVVYERNNRKFMLPASNMKIVTAAAGLLRLGPDFRYETVLKTNGPIQNGKLMGNLYVIGSGDPTISSRMQNGDALAVFREWADELRAQGIRQIDGAIVGVDQYFDDQRVGAGWPAGSLNSPYAAEVSALQFNDNVIAVIVRPGKSGRQASVRLSPSTRHVRVQNRVVTRRGHSNRFVAYRSENSNNITVRGRIGTSDGTDVRYITVHDPANYFAEVLRETFTNKGIKARSSRRASTEEADSLKYNSDQYQILWTHSSPPLSVIITEMMKSSHNLFADSIAKTIGAKGGNEGSFHAAQEMIRQTLTSLGVNPSELIMEDGSGLSRDNYVTPNLLSQILIGMHRSNLFQSFYDSFPIAGVDGTLRNRMTGTAVEAKLRAKTGYIRSVRSLSGYVQTKDGEQMAFVMLVNDYSFSLRGVDAAQEQVCLELAEFSRK